MEIAGYIVTNGIAVMFVFLSWRNPRFGRMLFFVLFLSASCLNLYTASWRPDVYQYFAKLAWFEFHRAFITGWFKTNASWFVTAIAIGQLFISLSMWTKGLVLKIGALAAILFFISIAPLGFGSAFPASLIMALAMYFIFKTAGREYT